MTAAIEYVRSARDEPIDTSVLENRPSSVGHLFRGRVEATPDWEAYRYPVGDSWESVTWSQVRERAYRLAAGLIALGVAPEDRVAIASSTRYEWVLADIAIMCAGAATTTIYPTTIPGDVSFILSDSGSRVVFAEDVAQVVKLREKRDEIPEVTTVVAFDPLESPDDAADQGGDGWVISLDELEELGVQLLTTNPGEVDARIDATTPDRLATIIYTSGTTGRPKGVRLLHDAWTYEAATAEAMPILSADDLQYLWLPLAHVFGKVLIVQPMQLGFPTAIDGRIDKIVENLAVVRPTFMGSAPRVFEKAYSTITSMIEREGGVKAQLFHWAVAVGAEVSDLRRAGQQPTGLLARKHALADRLVLAKVRERFGGRIRFFISGSAALNHDIARWFDALGMPVAEGYGLTETAAGTTVNRQYAHKIGTVGWPVPGTMVRVAHDGEILVKGPGVMEGYHHNPEASAEAKDADGWLHTGDIGEVDEDGFVRITDRKKDLFKTSNGKYVAPSAIESTFKGLCPHVSQFLVHGADRNFVTALITLDPDAIQGWAKANDLGGRSYEEIVSSGQAHDMVQGYVEQLNAGLNRWEQVRKFVILHRDLTVEDGELTPSLKLRRKVVRTRFKDELDALYSA